MTRRPPSYACSMVDASARGLGIGHRLVDECLRFARGAAGYKRMMLWTNDILTDARKIYEKAGSPLVEEEAHHSFGKDLVGQIWARNREGRPLGHRRGRADRHSGGRRRWCRPGRCPPMRRQPRWPSASSIGLCVLIGPAWLAHARDPDPDPLCPEGCGGARRAGRAPVRRADRAAEPRDSACSRPPPARWFSRPCRCSRCCWPCWSGQEAFSLPKLTGLVCAVSGVAVLLHGGALGGTGGVGGGTHLGAMAALIGATVIGAVSSLAGSALAQRYPALPTSVLAMCAAVVSLLALCATTGQPLWPSLSLTQWGHVAFIGLSSGVGYFCWLWALTRLEASRVVGFQALGPVTAAVLELLVGRQWPLVVTAGVDCAGGQRVADHPAGPHGPSDQVPAASRACSRKERITLAPGDARRPQHAEAAAAPKLAAAAGAWRCAARRAAAKRCRAPPTRRGLGRPSSRWPATNSSSKRSCAGAMPAGAGSGRPACRRPGCGRSGSAAEVRSSSCGSRGARPARAPAPPAALRAADPSRRSWQGRTVDTGTRPHRVTRPAARPCTMRGTVLPDCRICTLTPGCVFTKRARMSGSRLCRAVLMVPMTQLAAGRPR